MNWELMSDNVVDVLKFFLLKILPKQNLFKFDILFIGLRFENLGVIQARSELVFDKIKLLELNLIEHNTHWKASH